MQRTSTPPAEHDRRTTRRTTAALVAAVVAFAVQQTSIVPAVHDVQEALHGTTEWSSWLVTVYLIVATVATPAMGRLGDLHGRRPMLLAGLGLFAAASVGGALAPNLAVLICCRAVQGVGGSVYPLALALARQTVPRERSTATIALLTGAFGVGTAIGFVAGGLLSEFVTWRAVFVLGAVLVLLAGWLVLRTVPDTGDRATGTFDLAGTTVLAVSAMTLLSGFTLVVPLGWRSPATIGLLVVAVVAAVAWVRHERRAEDPLIDLGVLRNRKVAVGNLATIGLGWALFGSYLLIPQLARSAHGLGLRSAAIGLLLLPLAVGQTVCGPLAGWASRRVSARTVFAGGLLLLTAGLVILAIARTSVAAVACGALLLGMGAGTSLQAGSAVATEGVPADVAAVSAAVNSTVRRLAGGIGGQVDMIILSALATAAYPVSYAVAGALCVGGTVLVLTGRHDRSRSGYPPEQEVTNP